MVIRHQHGLRRPDEDVRVGAVKMHLRQLTGRHLFGVLAIAIASFPVVGPVWAQGQPTFTQGTPPPGHIYPPPGAQN